MFIVCIVSKYEVKNEKELNEILNNEENKLIDQSINEMKSLNRKKIKTAFVEFKNFYPAEDYHQNYYKENPTRYYSYLLGCGRPARLKEIWK